MSVFVRLLAEITSLDCRSNSGLAFSCDLLHQSKWRLASNGRGGGHHDDRASECERERESKRSGLKLSLGQAEKVSAEYCL